PLVLRHVDDQLILDIHQRVLRFKERIRFTRLSRSHRTLKLFDGSDVPLDKLESHLLRSLSRQLSRIAGNAIVRVVEYHHSAEPWGNLFKDLQALRSKVDVPGKDPC